MGNNAGQSFSSAYLAFMNTNPLLTGHDCTCSELTRRNFLRATGAGLAAAAVAPMAASALDIVTKVVPAETLVTTLHKTLNEKQRAAICFPFDHALRSKVDNNWHITKSAVADMTDDQRDLVKAIFDGLHSPEYRETVYKQVMHDAGKAGFGDSSVAFFGEPGSGKFEFVFTGRHCTRRCDGDSVAGAAFGGPIFYGHAAAGFNEKADHAGNVYWYQAKRANEVFQALDGKQRKVALLGESRGENGNDTVKLKGKTTGIDGLRVGEMTADQKGLVRKVLADLLAPFRKVDTDEAMKLIEKNGFDNLHMAFYQKENIGEDETWDVWQIEGPAMVWYFRGKPHVHTWVHIRESA